MRHSRQRPSDTHGPSLGSLLREIACCHVCADDLPLGPRPVLQVNEKAGLLIISQAPGSKVHHSGIPWNDSSGDRLRHWLGLDASDFYDSAQVALLPIGLCYPGAAKSGGDNPPRPECADLWHDRLIACLPQIELTILVGQYAQRRYLGGRCKSTLTKTVAAFSEYRPTAFPLPHPSWRSALWAQKNPWFERDVLPELRTAVRASTRRRADRDPRKPRETSSPFLQSRARPPEAL
jgi:uracil-DNA glycosylase